MGLEDMLPEEHLGLVLAHLSPWDAAAAQCTCRAFARAWRENTAVYWAGALRAPLVRPYVDHALGPTAEAFRRAMHLARAWRGVTADAGTLASLVPFRSFVRAVRVDARRGVLVAGLHSGEIQMLHFRQPPGAGRFGTVAPGRPNPPFRGRHLGQVLALDFDADAGVCVSGGGEPSYHEAVAVEPEVMVWDLATGIRKGVLRGHTDSVTDVRVLGEGSLRAASASADGSVVVWDLEGLRAVHRLAGHAGKVVSVAPLAGTALLTAGADRRVLRWDWASGVLAGEVLHSNQLSPVSCMHADAGDGSVSLGHVNGSVEVRAHRGPGDPFAPGQGQAWVAVYTHRHDTPAFQGAHACEVAAVHHDSDKAVSVCRSGEIACAFYVRGAVMDTACARAWSARHLRMYVTSVSCDRALLVHDGRDNQVLFLGFPPDRDGPLPRPAPGSLEERQLPPAWAALQPAPALGDTPADDGRAGASHDHDHEGKAQDAVVSP